ncbi:hypothetical protein [Pedobacter sp. AK013]|nr:hypothetical protein [Pedobacter sp. AK013]
MHFQLIQLSREEPWMVFYCDQVLAGIIKEREEWKQLSGEILPEGLL